MVSRKQAFRIRLVLQVAAILHLLYADNPTSRKEAIIVLVSFSVWGIVFLGQSFGFVDPSDLPRIWGPLGYVVVAALAHAVGVEYGSLKERQSGEEKRRENGR